MARVKAKESAKIKRFYVIFFAQLPSLPFGDDAIMHYGEIRAFLAKAGTPIGPNDLLIAAIAKAHQVTLVTHNTAEFSRVPGILLADWQA